MKETISTFEISSLDFFKFQSFAQKLKFLNLVPKMLYLGVWAAFSKNYCHIWWPSSKNKNPLIWDQKYLIWVFRKSSSKNYSHIWNHSSQIFLIVKFRVGINMSKFWTQNTYLGISLKFQIWRNYCHIWNQQSRICLNKKKVLCTKKKNGTKNVLSECFEQQFLKLVVIFEVSVLKFVLLRSLVQT